MSRWGAGRARARQARPGAGSVQQRGAAIDLGRAPEPAPKCIEVLAYVDARPLALVDDDLATLKDGEEEVACGRQTRLTAFLGQVLFEHGVVPGPERAERGVVGREGIDERQGRDVREQARVGPRGRDPDEPAAEHLHARP